MSPGRCALPPGMFSTAATMPMTRCLTPSAFRVPIMAMTLQAPHLSYFMSHMPSPGLMLMPPVSKQTPLPTTTMVFFAPAGLWSMMMSCSSFALPWPTAVMAP